MSSRESELAAVGELSRQVKKPIAVGRYIRRKIIQEEIIDAYQSPLPSAVVVNGRPKMVEVGDWVVIHADGSKSAYRPGEFSTTFEPLLDNQGAVNARGK